MWWERIDEQTHIWMAWLYGTIVTRIQTWSESSHHVRWQTITSYIYRHSAWWWWLNIHYSCFIISSYVFIANVLLFNLQLRAFIRLIEPSLLNNINHWYVQTHLLLTLSHVSWYFLAKSPVCKNIPCCEKEHVIYRWHLSWNLRGVN